MITLQQYQLEKISQAGLEIVTRNELWESLLQDERNYNDLNEYFGSDEVAFIFPEMAEGMIIQCAGVDEYTLVIDY